MNKYEYKKGDFVEVSYMMNDGSEGGVYTIEEPCYITDTDVNNGVITVFSMMFNDAIQYKYANGEYANCGDVVTRKLNPKEVFLDFGSGIKGQIRISIYSTNSTRKIIVIHGDYTNAEFHVIDINPLSEPMKSIVIGLLKAQEEV